MKINAKLALRIYDYIRYWERNESESGKLRERTAKEEETDIDFRG